MPPPPAVRNRWGITPEELDRLAQLAYEQLLIETGEIPEGDLAWIQRTQFQKEQWRRVAGAVLYGILEVKGHQCGTNT